MIRKTYSVEFRKQAVQMALSGEKSKTQTARDLGINENMLYRWIDKYGPNAPSETTDDKAELARLRKALVRAEMERVIVAVERSSDRGVYIIGTKDIGEPLLLPNSATLYQPQFSPDGKHIVCIGDHHDLFVVDRDGGNAQRVTQDGDYKAQPMFLPGGEQILYMRAKVTSRYDLCQVNRDGTGTIVILPSKFFDRPERVGR